MNIIVDQIEEATRPVPATTIRPGAGSDQHALARLAALEDRPMGSSPHLVAEQDGELVASLSLRDGTALGDPFRATEDTIALLRVRARQVAPARSGERRLKQRIVALTSTALLAGALLAGSALASASIAIAGAPVKINPQTRTFGISVTCTSADAACVGVLDVRTAGKIKPYSSQPAAVARVGTFPFRIPAGTTATVKGRVYGPALAQATLRGHVVLSLTPRAISGDLGPAKSVVFTYRRS